MYSLYNTVGVVIRKNTVHMIFELFIRETGNTLRELIVELYIIITQKL